jgi:hypothetical protein
MMIIFEEEQGAPAPTSSAPVLLVVRVVGTGVEQHSSNSYKFDHRGVCSYDSPSTRCPWKTNLPPSSSTEGVLVAAECGLPPPNPKRGVE